MKLLFLVVGGGAGTLLRYLISSWGPSVTEGGFPLGTLIVNAMGCFVIGALGAYFAGPQVIREEYRIALLVGLLGAFTTFSTFGWETFALARDGLLRLMLVNVVSTNVLSLGGVWIGYRTAESWLGV